MTKITKNKKFRFYFGLILLVVLIGLVGVKLWAGRNVKAAWFDTNWEFRQKIPISNTSGTTQTDFQVKLAGSNAINTASLIANGKMQTNCNDMRFTDINGKTLPFWIEPTTCNTSSTIVWIKVSSIASQTTGATTDIYFYYGNPSTGSGSSTPAQVFINDMGAAAAAWPLDDTTSTQSYSEVVNPAVANGRNIVLNGTFDTDTSWTKGTGWDINTTTLGEAHATTAAVNALLNPTTAILTVGKAYKITYDVVVTTGTVRVEAGTGALGTTRSASGTYTETLVATTTTALRFNPVSTFTGDIDNVSVQEINIPASTSTPTQLLVDGDMETAGVAAWSVSVPGTFTKDTTSPHSGTKNIRIARLANNNPWLAQTILTIGKVYRVTGYVRSDGFAQARYVINGSGINVGTLATTWQPFDFTFVATTTGFGIQALTSTGSQYVEFDDIVVAEDNYIRSGELFPDGGMESLSDSGTASSGGATTLTDSTKTWVVNIYANQILTIIGGTGSGQSRTISTNTSTVITVSSAWTVNPDNTSVYQVVPYFATLNTPVVSKQTGTPHGGSYVLRIARNGTNTPAITIPVFVTGKTYRVTGYGRSDGNGNGKPYIGGSNQGITGTTSTAWQFLDVTFTDVGQNVFIADCSGALNTDYCEFDDVSVTEVDPLVGVPTLGVTLGSSTGASGHLTNAYTFDGTNDNVNIYSSSLNSAFNPSEGTLVAWAKVSSAAIWNNTVRRIVNLQVDASNQISIYKTATLNQLEVDYIAGGTTKSVTDTSLAGTTGWFQLAISWSKSGDQVKAYINNAQVGSTQTGLGTWSGNLLSTTAIIGALNTSGTNPWSGLINDVRLYTRALSSSEIANLYSASSDIQAYYTGNYVGHELVRKYNTSVTLGTAGSEEIDGAPSIYWKFDTGTGTTAKDSSSNANSGTLGGSTIPTWQTEDLCVSGKCLFFDGASSKITGSKVVSGVESISFWVKPNAIATQGLINFDGGTHKISTNGSGVLSATGFVSPIYYINGLATTNPTLVINRWNHVEITTGTAFNTIAGFTVGTDGTNFIKGFIDEVKFYPYARNASQVLVDATNNVQKQTFLNDGLVGYWKMDESSGNPLDSSGGGNTLTNNNTATFTTGKFGNAGTFNGSNEYFSTAVTLSGVKTISFWVNPASTTDNFMNLANGIYLNSSSGNLSLIGATGTIYVNGSASSITSASSWQLVTVTIPAGVSASQIEVGRANGSYTGNGSKIDDVRFYNRELSPAEVAALYNWAPGPVGWWKMDDKVTGDAKSLVDSSSNSNTATTHIGANITGMNCTATGKYGSSCSFDGVDDYASVANVVSAVESVSFWVNPATTSQYLMDLDGGTHYLSASSGVVSATGFSFPIIYVNGILGGTITANAWNHVEVTTATAFNTTSSMTFGKANGSNFLNGKLDEIKLYAYQRSQSQILEDFGNNPQPSSSSGRLPTPLAYWKFDEQYGSTANNSGSGGSTYNGNITTGTWLTKSSCKINGCINLTGDSSTVSAGDLAFVDSATSFSTSFWINPQTLGTNLNILSKANTSTQRVFQILTDASTNTEIRVMVSSSASDTGNYCTTSGLGLTASSWQSLAIVYDGTLATGNNIKVYKNGNLITCSVIGTIPASLVSGTTSNFKLGKGDDTDNALLAEYDEVKIYNSSLTQSQVQIDYNAGASMNFGTSANSETSLLSDGAGTAPVGYWQLEEAAGVTAFDTSGNGTDGTWNGTGGHQVVGKLGKAGGFNGSDDYLSFAGTVSGIKSVSFWAYPASASQYFLDFDGGTHYISASSGVVSATGFAAPTIYVNGISGAGITASTWNYITVTTGTSFNSSASMTYGKVVAGGNNFLNGKLDEIKIYNYTRTQGQVSYDYNRGMPVGQWKFDECQGNTINDSSGNGNSGTINSDRNIGTCNTSSTVWGDGASGKFNASLGLDGTGDYVNEPTAISNVQTVSFWVKPASSTSSMLQLTSSANVTSASGVVTAAGFISPAYYVNGVATSSPVLTAGSWNHIVVTTGTGISANAIKFGLVGSTYYAGQIDDLRIYNYSLSASQIQEVYNQGSSVRFGPTSGTP